MAKTERTERFVVVVETASIAFKPTFSRRYCETRREAIRRLAGAEKRIKGNIVKRAYIVDRKLQPWVLI